MNNETIIKVFGIGGAGNNAVARMQENDIKGVELFIANTDNQVLQRSPVANKILLGTSGLGAGGNPVIGKQAAEECTEEIRKYMKGADMVFIAAGMGGGTGTGAAPVFAKLAKEEGCLTVAVVTKPFKFEGRNRMRNAVTGLDELVKNVDSYIVIPNEKLQEVLGDYPINEAFLNSDNILVLSVIAVTELISTKLTVNLDFADVKSVMKDKGKALIGVGRANSHSSEDGRELSGEEIALLAADNAINCPLLESNIKGATDAIVNFTGGTNLTINHVSKAVQLIEDRAESEINTIWGVNINPALDNEVIVTVIATGFDSNTKDYSQQTQFTEKPFNDLASPEKRPTFNVQEFFNERNQK
ncbi:MAG: cell division protein FtsZ [Erysipelotrichaceae bacterium]|nr:cell division protein FtsZ [Erysipelotrichaceae bacterium]